MSPAIRCGRLRPGTRWRWPTRSARLSSIAISAGRATADCQEAEALWGVGKGGAPVAPKTKDWKTRPPLLPNRAFGRTPVFRRALEKVGDESPRRRIAARVLIRRHLPSKDEGVVRLHIRCLSHWERRPLRLQGRTRAPDPLRSRGRLFRPGRRG